MKRVNTPKLLRERAWHIHGRRVTFYLPGMFRIDDRRGKYPGLSITGSRCVLQCKHCRGRLLKNMSDCTSPEALLNKCLELDRLGFNGCLITGGSSPSGKIPWDEFFPVLKQIKQQTSLLISVHSGLLTEETARRFHETGVDRVLIDVVGSEETLAAVHNLACGISSIEDTLRHLSYYRVPFVPHIVIGIHEGKIHGEKRALEMIKKYEPPQLNLVVFMQLTETPLAKCPPPPLNEVADILFAAREMFIDIPLALGCGRPRGSYSIAVERAALDLGFNKIALWNDETLAHAQELGITYDFKETCCCL